TSLVKDINPGGGASVPFFLTTYRGQLYFVANDGTHGFELWKSDGTAAGTMMLKNLNKDGAPSSDPDRFFVADDYLYFAAWNGFATRDYRPLFTFWRTDGTSGGTVEVGDQIAGDFGDFAAGRRLLFTGNNPFGLWTTDGSPASEQPATEFENRFPGTPSVRYVSGDKIFVLSGEDLYVTTIDYGAPAVSLGASDVTFGFGELAGRVLFFTESAGTYDHALWITDGTPAGTHVVRSFEERSGGSLVAMSGHAYFVVSDDVNNGFMLWRTDGTAEGTVAVTEVPGFYKPVVTGGRMFFRTNDGGKLWVTDGTAAGTRELPVAVGGSIAPIGNSVVFIAADTTSGTEPWVSDGTPEGTHLLADIYPGAGGSAAGSMTAAGTVAYFYAYSKNEGDELWMTDGTTAGTRLAGDIEPGPLSSYPFNLIRAGERVYFTPRQTTTGKELWAVDLPPTPRLTIADVRTNENGVAHFTARLHKASPQTVTVEYATSDGTASATSDYDSATGTLTFAAGETAKSFDVHIRADAAMEENETFLVTLRNAAGAAIETSVAAAIIEDDDRSADLALAADFSNWGGITLDMTNHGPGVATNIRGTMTAVPVTYEPAACWYCPFVQLAPNETERALSYAETEHQQYLTATVTALEDDPQPSNNTLAWTTNGLLTMNALHLTPGASATIWHRNYQPIPAFSVESSDPSVVSVPASVSGATSFAVQGLKAGRATVRAFTAQQTIGTIAVDVIAPGTKVRYADAILFFPDYYQVLFDDRAVIHSFSMGSAPFTGARPTGIVTVTAGVFELTRMQLAGDGKRIALRFLLPSVGTHTVTVTYEGDENFLPVTETFEMQSLKGSVNVNATATRQGENVILRVRISGSPAAAPTGTIRAGMQEELIALTPIGPGLSAAEVTIPHGDATTIDVTYYGDTNYTGAVQSVPVMDARRRSTRH
ncbi:MAG TPA: ELWxxDGT repeat protein, partial [Thermoanaerobaculia bacterium]